MFTRFRGDRGSKAKDQEAHALRRAYLRYGLRLNKHDLHDIGKLVREGKSTCVQTQSNRVSVHDLTYKDVPIRVVYDKQRKTVVTFLTDKMGMWE